MSNKSKDFRLKFARKDDSFTRSDSRVMPDLSITNESLSYNDENQFLAHNKILRQNDEAGLDKKRYSLSGTGILEFSPTHAGQDITPVNLDFNKKTKKLTTTTSFQSLAGKKQ